MSDEKFKEELLRLIKFTVEKIEENANQIDLLRKNIDKNTRELKSLRKEIRAHSGAENNVNFKVLEMFNRLFDIEKQVNFIANKFPELKQEHKRIFSESLKLAENMDDNPDAKVQLDELSVWLENLEEKVFA